MPTYQQRFGQRPSPSRPARPQKPPAPRSSEISAGLPTPRQQRQAASLTPRQRAAALHAYRAYVSGGRQSDAKSFFNSPALNWAVGKQGLGGAAVQVAKGLNPVETAKQAAAGIEHPLRRLGQGGQGIIFPGGGAAEAGLSREAAAAAVKTPAEKVAGSLGAARKLRAEQAKLYSAERSARVGRGAQALEQAGGGIAGFKAGMAQLGGELPKTTFNRLREGNLTHADLEGLVRQAQQHPELRFFEKQRVTKALIDAWEHGVTPTKGEIKLLQTTFGQDAAKEMARIPLWHRAVSVVQIPRSTSASFDVSAPFRQGLVAGAGHPKIFARNFPGMFKALVSEKAYQGILTKIHERPNYDLMKESGVKFTELGHDVGKREEAFMSDLAERIPAIGRVVRASGRAYTGFLDNLRADIFDSMVEADRRKGVNVEDRKYLSSVSRYANAATGRGSLGPLEHWAPAMNSVFFSPRLIAARLNMLNPVWYAHLHPAVRAQAIKSMAALLTATAAGLEIGHAAGGKVGTDPRSADFAKLKLGNTRIDPLGGFQQYGRLASQLASGKIVSSTTGKTLALGPGYGKLTRKDIAERFVAGKLNPSAAALYDLLQGQTYTGGKLNWKSELAQKTVPLALQDAYDQYRNSGSLPLGLLAYGGSALGLGVQTYGKKAPKGIGRYGGKGGGRSRNPLGRGGGGGGGNTLLRGGTGGGSNPYLRR